MYPPSLSRLKEKCQRCFLHLHRPRLHHCTCRHRRHHVELLYPSLISSQFRTAQLPRRFQWETLWNRLPPISLYLFCQSSSNCTFPLIKNRRVCVQECPKKGDSKLQCMPTDTAGCKFHYTKGYEVVNYENEAQDTRSGRFCYPTDKKIKE